LAGRRFPAPRRRRGAARGAIPWYDVVAAILALACGAFSALHFPRLVAMISLVPTDALVVAAILIALTLEATRRATGYTLVWVTVILFAYVLIGHLVPGAMETRRVEAGQVAVYLGFDTNALPGQMMDIAYSVVVTFIVFGYLLAKSGGGAFFNDLAMAAMGRYRGGPAKIAVVGSSLFGTISGVAAANAVAVGVVTIPMMKRSGVPATQAAAIEACASNGGQLMPPVMGAVAFVMADFLQVPYAEVALAALLPAILYYVSLFVQADLEAARHGYGRVAEAEIPRLHVVLLRGAVFALPFGALLGVMFVLNWERRRAR
jgi:TRAP transporter 4TM/12TM fusion protein